MLGIWPSLFSIVSCFGWPEGPYWLASVGRIAECRKVYHWLRGPECAHDEISDFIQRIKSDLKPKRKSNIVNRMRKAMVYVNSICHF